MIYVNSSIMGSGKTMAAITYMKEHPEERYLFISPYLSEDDRVYEACPELHFVKPNGRYPGRDNKFGKLSHVADIIEQGRNIVTTHSLFKMMTPEILDMTKKLGYVLMVDESLDVLEKTEFDEEDIQVLIDAGRLKTVDGRLMEGDSEYNGTVFKRDLFDNMKARDIVLTGGEPGDRYRWFLPIRMMTSFKDVFILTYLFDGQLMKYYLESADIQYQKIGVSRDDGGVFRFATEGFYVPEYLSHISEMIHIVDDEKMNEIGDRRTALSMAWFDGRGDKERLRKNLRKYFREMHPDTPNSEKLWGIFKKHKASVQDRGYARRAISFNIRATNDYSECTVIAYPVNVFMTPKDKSFFKARDLEFDESLYALSTMLQFLWRSAIRNGKPIDLYLPSSRMRSLLLEWMDDVSRGGGVTV